MDLSEITGSPEKQDKGHEFELLDPVTGQPTGIKLTMAGPDSERNRAARLAAEREISRLASRTGGLSSGDREKTMDDFLFALTISWDVKEKGKPVSFTKENFLRLLRAGTWVRAQVDGFAGDRTPYYGG